MKTHFLWLPVTLSILIAAIYIGVKEYAVSKKTVSKSVAFSVYKGYDYNSKIYNNTSAKVQITIEKVSSKSRVPVWQRTFDGKQLKQYPSVNNVVYQTVVIPGIHEYKEHLEVTYTILYNSRGSELQMQNSSIVSGARESKLEISI